MENLSAYQLACGGIQTYAKLHQSAKITLTLWREHGVYHVRSHNHDSHRRLVWECKRTLTEARRAFGNQRKQIRTGVLY
jgi:predicted metal-dependent hydrolase